MVKVLFQKKKRPDNCLELINLFINGVGVGVGVENIYPSKGPFPKSRNKKEVEMREDAFGIVDKASPLTPFLCLSISATFMDIKPPPVPHLHTYIHRSM